MPKAKKVSNPKKRVSAEDERIIALCLKRMKQRDKYIPLEEAMKRIGYEVHR